VKRIALMPNDPVKEEEHHFKKRAEALVERWKVLVYPGGDAAEGSPAQPQETDAGAAGETGGAAAEEAKEESATEQKEAADAEAAAPTTNGDAAAPANGESEPVAATA
jgi:hypothetical protein